MKIEYTEVLAARKTELNQARSKPDPVNQPVRTARTGTVMHHHNGNTETVSPDQHHISDVAKWNQWLDRDVVECIGLIPCLPSLPHLAGQSFLFNY